MNYLVRDLVQAGEESPRRDHHSKFGRRHSRFLPQRPLPTGSTPKRSDLLDGAPCDLARLPVGVAILTPDPVTRGATVSGPRFGTSSTSSTLTRHSSTPRPLAQRISHLPQSWRYRYPGMCGQQSQPVSGREHFHNGQHNDRKPLIPLHHHLGRATPPFML